MRLLFFALFFVTCMVLPSQAQEILTWDDCVAATLNHHPELLSAEEQLKQVTADRKITQGAARPQVRSGLSARTSRSAGQETNAFTYSVTGEQLLFDGQKTANSVKAANQDIRAAEYNYAVTSSNIRLALRTAYAGLLRAQELVSLTETILERRRQNVKLVQLRYEAGREHHGALLTAQADLANAEFEVSQARRNLALAQTRLVTAMGLTDPTPVVVGGGFPSPKEDQQRPDFTALAEDTPLLMEFVARKDAARFNLSAEKADFFPTVYLSTSAAQAGADWPPGQEEWGLGVSVSWPLFEGGSRKARVSKAEASLRQSQAEERSGRDSVILTLEQTWTDFMDAGGLLTVQEKFLAANEERARIASAQYAAGLINFDDWIIIEDNLVNSRKSYLDAQASVLIAEAQWIQAKGGTLDDAQ